MDSLFLAINVVLHTLTESYRANFPANATFSTLGTVEYNHAESLR